MTSVSHSTAKFSAINDGAVDQNEAKEEIMRHGRSRAVIYLITSIAFLWNAVFATTPQHDPDAGGGYLERPLLETFQVYAPPLSPTDLEGATSCSVTLMNHLFAQSAGMPFVGLYEPVCGNNWDIVLLNLSVVSFGIQFDRLGSVWIADTEVWRTCTAEPIVSGVHFTYSKDISNFKSLLQSSQTLVVDIGNYIVGPNNGSYNAILSATFYNITARRVQQAPDQIIPISNIQPNGISTFFSLPNDTASTSVFIPNNSSRVVLELFASGNANEEFWYSNVPEEFVNTFGTGNMSLLGQGSFREIQVYVDDQIVGVAWPFEVVFTGGWFPGFWRRIVDHRTFDLPSYMIDLTPLLDHLVGEEHEVRFEIRGQPNTLENWFISGHVQIWHSTSGGSMPCSPVSINYDSISPYADLISTGQVAGDNTSFSVTTLAARQESLASLLYENHQSYELLNNGSTFVQSIFQKTNFETPLFRGHYIFSINITQNTSPNGTVSMTLSLLQVFHRYTTDVIDGSVSLEHAEVSSVGSLIFNENTNLGSSHGNTSVMFRFRSPRREYTRNVMAIGVEIAYDFETDKQEDDWED